MRHPEAAPLLQVPGPDRMLEAVSVACNRINALRLGRVNVSRTGKVDHTLWNPRNALWPDATWPKSGHIKGGRTPAASCVHG